MHRLMLPFVSLFVLVSCVSPPGLPYPAFIRTDDLADVFLAPLPGVRAKRYAEDYPTQTGRYRVDVPPDWSGTSGGMPQAALELFVLEGELEVGDMKLIPGGYAYLPSGSLGFRLASASGARLLLFMSAEPAGTVIQSPLILDGVEASWRETAPGVSIRVLRFDPGSGARTWLRRTTTQATPVWRTSSVTREAYLVSGAHTMSECVNGDVRTGDYGPGGYFRRPPNTSYGGGDTAVARESIWFLRELSAGRVVETGACVGAEVAE